MKSADAVSSLVVTPAAGGRSVVRQIRAAAPLGLREVRDSGVELSPGRVAIVQTAAYLVGGDTVRLRVRVEPGAALELREISATLVHPGALARQQIDVDVREGARVSLVEQPLIIADGARLDRMLTISLRADARVVHRDTLVLGRHSEQPGSALVRLRVVRDDVPVLDETLYTGDLDSLRSDAIVGHARAIGALGRYGVNGPAPSDGFALGPQDVLVRRLAPDVRGLQSLAAVQDAWIEALHAR